MKKGKKNMLSSLDPMMGPGASASSAVGKGIRSAKHSLTSSKTIMGSISNLFHYLNSHVSSLNNSKVFAGLMIIILNISSKFVTIKLSKTMESYLKYSFSRNILVFAIAWMGTRDIYIALFITFSFILLMDFLLNEDSRFCCLPEHFTDYHVSLLDEKVSDEDVKKANEVLEKAKKQKEEEQKQTQ